MSLLSLIEKKRYDKEPYKDEEWLCEMWVEKNLSQQQIASKANVSLDTITRWVQRYDLTDTSRPSRPDKRILNEEWVRDNYVRGDYDIEDIAEECNCKIDVAREWVRAHSITLRPGDIEEASQSNPHTPD